MIKCQGYFHEAHEIKLTGNPLTGTYEWECRALLHMLRRTTGAILEIGTFRGGTANEICTAFPERQVISVDIHDPSYGLKLEELGAHAKHHPNYSLVVQDSKTYSIPRAVDTIFIDGDHTWEGCRLDTEKALAHMRNRSPGLIIWHDYYQAYEVMPYLDWLIEHGVTEITQVQCTTLAFRSF